MKNDNAYPLLPVTLYALQTCSHCRRAKKFLQQNHIDFRTIYVDLLVGEERNATIRRLKDVNPSYSFPTITVGQYVIVGFKEEKLCEALSITSK